MDIFLVSINKKIGNGKNTFFLHDRWILGCSLKTQFPLLLELATGQDITVDKVIKYNRYYLFLRRVINGTLKI
jgi:hypothetical protein